MPEPHPYAGRLVRYRTTLDLSQNESAQRPGVDSSALARWEQGKREPAGVFLQHMERSLHENEAPRTDIRCAE